MEDVYRKRDFQQSNQMKPPKPYILVLLNLFMILQAYAVSIVSWNIQDLGRTKDDAEIQFIAEVIRDFDIIAIQEVVAVDPAGAQAVARIAAELNRMGSQWDYAISAPTNSPSSSISERYAYIWKTNRVKLNMRGSLGLVNKLDAYCDREPFYAQFIVDEVRYDLLNFHSRPHDRDPQSEIEAISKLIIRNEHSHNWVLLGDFNIPEDDIVWNALYKHSFQSSVIEQKTSLKRVCDNGTYLSNAIDNIYVNTDRNTIREAKVIDIVMTCERLGQIREISDHLPIYVQLN